MMNVEYRIQNVKIEQKQFVLLCMTISMLVLSFTCFAQNKDLGEQQYVVVKDYKPVLA